MLPLPDTVVREAEIAVAIILVQRCLYELVFVTYQGSRQYAISGRMFFPIVSCRIHITKFEPPYIKLWF